MAFEFKFPDVGEGIAEGEIVKWHVKEGDSVKQDQVLLDVETDKAIVEIPSPRSGKILKIYHKEGDTVKVGEVIVSIEEEKYKEAKAEEPKAKEIKEEKKSYGVVGIIEEAPETEVVEVKKQVPLTPLIKTGAKEIVHAAPSTRRLARELNVDIAKIKGSGLDNRITEEDVRKHAVQKTQETKTTEIKVTKKYDLYGYIDHAPLKGVRKAVAKHMVQAKFTAPHVTHMDEADITELFKIREREKKKAVKKKINLTFMPFIIKASISALKEYPFVNSSLDDEHEEIILKKYYNIGFAVDTEDGLMVPVIKGADEKSILDIAKEIENLANQARERKIDLSDLKGSTFTITNVGSLGGIFATPIINYPETAILAVGKIIDKPVVIKNKIKIRKTLPLSLSFDHRVIDGAEAARFMNKLIEHLEDPDLLLVERA